MHLIDLIFHMLLPSRCGRPPCKSRKTHALFTSVNLGKAGCLHPRCPQTGCHVIHMVLCTLRGTREQIVVEQIVADPVPQILDGPQILERRVEVIKVVLQEQCQ